MLVMFELSRGLLHFIVPISSCFRCWCDVVDQSHWLLCSDGALWRRVHSDSWIRYAVDIPADWRGIRGRLETAEHFSYLWSSPDQSHHPPHSDTPVYPFRPQSHFDRTWQQFWGSQSPWLRLSAEHDGWIPPTFGLWGHWPTLFIGPYITRLLKRMGILVCLLLLFFSILIFCHL